MNCGHCSCENVVEMHNDPLVCDECGKNLGIGYYICHDCGFTFRTLNGKFLDGNHPADFDQAIQELAESMEEMPKTESMAELLCNCVKCGEPSCAPPVGEDLYRCPVCGFEWEILKHG